MNYTLIRVARMFYRPIYFMLRYFLLIALVGCLLICLGFVIALVFGDTKAYSLVDILSFLTWIPKNYMFLDIHKVRTIKGNLEFYGIATFVIYIIYVVAIYIDHFLARIQSIASLKTLKKDILNNKMEKAFSMLNQNLNRTIMRKETAGEVSAVGARATIFAYNTYFALSGVLRDTLEKVSAALESNQKDMAVSIIDTWLKHPKL
ncbi:MAG: hypothetical protein GC149_03105 [Gammaproteobacteria bacterium]|nr:hypothetical protein [Gammaproteobacteria bacterium]